MHPDEKALINAILHKPYDAAPRWVYADWLQERGRKKHEKLRREARIIGEATYIYRLTKLGREGRGFKIYGIWRDKTFEIKKDTGRIVFWPKNSRDPGLYPSSQCHYYKRPKVKLFEHQKRIINLVRNKGLNLERVNRRYREVVEGFDEEIRANPRRIAMLLNIPEELLNDRSSA